MPGERKDMFARVQLAVVTVLGLALVIVMPSLVITASDTANSITLGVLLLAMAALVRLGTRSVPLAPRARSASAATSGQAPPVLGDRVTDPVHHPLRPRAPEQA